MTYGWAILIIAVVLIALFQLGIFDSSNLTLKAQPGSCQVFKTVTAITLEGICNGALPEYITKAGINDYIIINDSGLSSSPTNIQGNQITITAWVNIYGQPYHDVIDKENQYGMKIDYKNTPHPCTPSNSLNLCLEWDTSNNWVGDSFPIPNSSFDQWMFLSVSMNGDKKYWYADGIKIGSLNQPNSIIYASSNIAIGSISPGYAGYGESEWFNGSISNVQIYNTALSSSDVQALYQEGIGGAPQDISNLVAWWPLNGNANDYSGNNNNGAATNVIYSGSWTSGYSAP